MSIQLAVILVPVLFGFLGFALDLGRLYLIRGELNQAANAMAVQAASQLLGTAASATNVQNALQSTNGPAYSYNFGTIPIGGSTTNLTSTIQTPVRVCCPLMGNLPHNSRRPVGRLLKSD